MIAIEKSYVELNRMTAKPVRGGEAINIHCKISIVFNPCQVPKNFSYIEKKFGILIFSHID